MSKKQEEQNPIRANPKAPCKIERRNPKKIPPPVSQFGMILLFQSKKAENKATPATTKYTVIPI